MDAILSARFIVPVAGMGLLSGINPGSVTFAIIWALACIAFEGAQFGRRR